MPASRRTFTHAARHCSSVPYSCSNSASVSPCMIARIDPIPCSPDSILHRFCGGRKGADWLISGITNGGHNRNVASGAYSFAGQDTTTVGGTAYGHGRAITNGGYNNNLAKGYGSTATQSALTLGGT